MILKTKMTFFPCETIRFQKRQAGVRLYLNLKENKIVKKNQETFLLKCPQFRDYLRKKTRIHDEISETFFCVINVMYVFSGSYLTMSHRTGPGQDWLLYSPLGYKPSQVRHQLLETPRYFCRINRALNFSLAKRHSQSMLITATLVPLTFYLRPGILSA